MNPCNKCGLERTKRADKSKKNGYQFVCNPCNNARNRARYATDSEFREKTKTRTRQNARNNPDQYAFNRQKRRAIRYQQTPEMSVAELVELRYFYKYNAIMPGNWHVDHIDPLDKGGLHHPNNLQILSQFDNLSKGAK